MAKNPNDVLNPGQALNQLRAELQVAHPDMSISDINRLIAPGQTRTESARRLAEWLQTRPAKT